MSHNSRFLYQLGGFSFAHLLYLSHWAKSARLANLVPRVSSDVKSRDPGNEVADWLATFSLFILFFFICDSACGDQTSFELLPSLELACFPRTAGDVLHQSQAHILDTWLAAWLLRTLQCCRHVPGDIYTSGLERDSWRTQSLSLLRLSMGRGNGSFVYKKTNLKLNISCRFSKGLCKY